VQGLLLSCCLGVFYYKLKKEEENLGETARSRGEFLLDASKQFAGAGWIHLMNLGFASAMSNGNQCEWYWINIMVDTTLGTAVAYVLLQIASAFIKKRFSPEAAEDFKSGEYKDIIEGEFQLEGQINFNKYIKQLVVWLLVVSCMKVLMVVFMFLFSGPLLAVAGFILAPFLTQPWLKLLVVMIVFPLLMDGFQIWMVDNFIKKKKSDSLNSTVPDPDLEEPPAHVDAAADALLNFSQRCEVAAEAALISLKARYEQHMNREAYGEQLHEQHTDPQKGHDNESSLNNFDTQWKFQTIIPPDQAMSSGIE